MNLKKTFRRFIQRLLYGPLRTNARILTAANVRDGEFVDYRDGRAEVIPLCEFERRLDEADNFQRPAGQEF